MRLAGRYAWAVAKDVGFVARVLYEAARSLVGLDGRGRMAP